MNQTMMKERTSVKISWMKTTMKISVMEKVDLVKKMMMMNE